MRYAVVCAILALAAPAWAGYAGPVHDPAAIERFLQYRGPSPTPALLDVWQKGFLGQPVNRAIAVSPAGHVGTGFGWSTVDEATSTALRSCGERAKTECALYAVNTDVVYPGLESALPRFEVKIGDLVLRNEFLFRGPERAKGVVVWSHGYGGQGVEQRKAPPPGVMSRFNMAGWDVLRFDRDPWYDADIPSVETQLADSLDKVRAAGYRRIVLAGQSRGAWQSLDLMRRGRSMDGLVGILAFSPAKNGTEGSRPMLTQPDEWRRVIDRMDPAAYRVAVAFFDHDDYNPAAADEAETARRILSAHGIDNLVLLERDPEILKLPNGRLSGHGAASHPRFTAVYADCLVRFIDGGTRDGRCQ